MILLTGGTGYVGQAFLRHLLERGMPHVSPDRSISGDLSDFENAKRLIRSSSPTAVINAAGWPGSPNVDATVTQPVRCIASNLGLPLALARACREQGIPLGHVSTGCIYSGEGISGQGFSEFDCPNFGFWSSGAGLYSRCKDLAETSLSLIHPETWCWRLRMPFDHRDHPKNYLSKILRYDRLLDARNSISNLDDFVTACLGSITNRIPYGTYNLTNPGSVTTREIVGYLIRSGVAPAGKKWDYFSSESDFLGSVATVRRAVCVLDSRKIAQAGLPMPSIEEALQSATRKWTDSPIHAKGMP